MNESNVVNIKDKKISVVITVILPNDDPIQFDPVEMNYKSLEELQSSLNKIGTAKLQPFVGMVDGHVYFIPGELLSQSIVCYSKAEEGV